MKPSSIKICAACLLMLCMYGGAQAQDVPYLPLWGLYPNYFTLYDRGNPLTMPAGSVNVSTGVAYIEGDVLFATLTPTRQGGTGFFIETYRDDDTVCFCTAGHVAEGVMNGGHAIIPGIEMPTQFFTLYMDYLGGPSSRHPGSYDVTSGIASPYMRGMIVYSENEINDNSLADISLVLLRKSDLPMVRRFTMLGYELSDLSAAGGNALGSTYYAIGHPYARPQTLSDRLRITNLSTNNNPFVLQTALPFAIGQSSAGSPLVLKSVNGTPSSDGTVVGLIQGGNTITEIPRGELYGDDGEYLTQRIRPLRPSYSGDKIYGTQMSRMSAAILKHCFKDEEKRRQVLASGAYRVAGGVSNAANVDAYSTAATVSSVSDLTSALGGRQFLFDAAVYDRNKPADLPSVYTTYLRGSTVSLGGINIPTKHPSQPSMDWLEHIWGTEARVAVSDNTEFSYQASGYSELDITGIAVEASAGAAAGMAMGAPTMTQAAAPGSLPATSVTGFSTRPNPSATGLFVIDVPLDKGGYEVTVYGPLGNTVLRGRTNGGSFTVNLGAMARGVYMAVLRQGDAVRYTTRLLFQ